MQLLRKPLHAADKKSGAEAPPIVAMNVRRKGYPILGVMPNCWK